MNRKYPEMNEYDFEKSPILETTDLRDWKIKKDLHKVCTKGLKTQLDLCAKTGVSYFAET
jgi:hypothetical protein